MERKSKPKAPNSLFIIPYSQPGYTLIEILVTMTIISIIFGAGYVAYRDFSRRQTLASAVRSVKADLRLAQEEALAGKKPQDGACTGTNTLEGYNFDVVPPDSYRIFVTCVGSTGGTVQTKSVSLSSGVTIAAGSVNPILFKVLGRGTNITSSSVIALSAYGLTQNITVGSGGNIE
ncbi:prepilin-type N-terminal cleavage/methylation domain-containing protein [Candidatus Woesebacteria bacterium]|nr:prepilin-type N-terminal cleavage/methylation domain-containing protein [Candidatus Woesebacteria bacterium]